MQAAAAERAALAAQASDQRARERLLVEQRRLSEAMEVTSALASHMREVGRMHVPSVPSHHLKAYKHRTCAWSTSVTSCLVQKREPISERLSQHMLRVCGTFMWQL